jgi:hypothetical protein
MNFKYSAMLAALIASSLLAMPGANAQQKKDNQQIDGAKEAKEAADRAAKKNPVPSYDVKKSHDEHISATEKAGGEAQRTKKPDKPKKKN